MQTSSRKGLATTSGNTDPHFLPNTWKGFRGRTAQAGSWNSSCGGWAKCLCLLIFNCSDYPRVLRSPNVCLTGSVCLFQINLGRGMCSLVSGWVCWMGSRGWEGSELSYSRHTPGSANKEIQSFHLLFNHFQWMQTFFFPPFLAI